jgi:HPt (histidine-containing phosphotransfer) domain-containing protein
MVDQLTKPIAHEDLITMRLRHTRRGSLPPLGPPAPTRPPTAMVVLDWDALTARYVGKEGFVKRLLTLALNSNADTPARLRRWVEEGNLSDIASAAHTLKSSAGNLMAYETAAAAERVVRAVRQGNPAAAGLTLELADALERMLTLITGYIGGTAQGSS